MNKKIPTHKKEQYLEWLMTPKGQREPASKEAMAELLEVSARTLYYWEGQEEFQAQLRRLKLEWGSRWYPDILSRLMDIVENGPPAQSVQAAKTLLAHIDVKTDEEQSRAEGDSETITRIKEALRKEGFSVIGDAE